MRWVSEARAIARYPCHEAPPRVAGGSVRRRWRWCRAGWATNLASSVGSGLGCPKRRSRCRGRLCLRRSGCSWFAGVRAYPRACRLPGARRPAPCERCLAWSSSCPGGAGRPGQGRCAMPGFAPWSSRGTAKRRPLPSARGRWTRPPRGTNSLRMKWPGMDAPGGSAPQAAGQVTRERERSGRTPGGRAGRGRPRRSRPAMVLHDGGGPGAPPPGLAGTSGSGRRAPYPRGRRHPGAPAPAG